MIGVVPPAQVHRAILRRHGRVDHREGDVLGLADGDAGGDDGGGHFGGDKGGYRGAWGDGVDGDVWAGGGAEGGAEGAGESEDLKFGNEHVNRWSPGMFYEMGWIR